MKEAFILPEMEIVTFESEDVITTSLPIVPYALQDEDMNGIEDIYEKK